MGAETFLATRPRTPSRISNCGAEMVAFQSSRPRTPSRISNCGEMVAESVLQQLEEELLLEEMAVQREFQSPGGRKLLLGIKLNASCREMLAWTIAELAKPGDHILAFHVSSFAMHSGRVPTGTTSREHEEYFDQLANTLRGFLAVYDGLCVLKNIKLEVEILPGVEVKKVLVDFAKNHKTCKLILGSNKHFTHRRNKSLGRYCLKRLPNTCTVVILQHGEIILNEKGTISTDLTRMIKTLRKGMKSFGRSKQVMNGVSNECPDDSPRPSEDLQLTLMELSHDEQSIEYRNHSTELEKCDFFDSYQFQGSSMMSSSKVKIQRADMFLLQDQNDTQITSTTTSLSLHTSPSYYSGDSETSTISEEELVPGWPLMHHSIGFDKIKPVISLLDRPLPDKESPAPSSLRCLSLQNEKSASSSPQRRFSDKAKPPRSPIHRMFSDRKITVTNRMDRQMSVVDWALQLPHRNRDVSKSPKTLTEEDYAKILREMARDAFRARSDVMDEEAGSDDLDRANKKMQFSLSLPTTRDWSKLDVHEEGKMSLAQRLDTLCLNRKCTTYVYQELEAATSNFSSSNVVGRGGGSDVYKGMMPDGRLVAVKCLNYGPQAEGELLNDVSINTTLSHSHVVSLLGYCVDTSHLLLVYDYLPEGNLEVRLHAGTKALVLPWGVRYQVAVGIAKALDYLHHGTSHPVIHRDVKASNILLTANFESQLSDFGLAKWAPRKASHILCDDILGTFGYLAPEYFMYGRVNNKTDVYAFGVVLLELITGRPPIDNTKPKGHENLVNWARPLLKDNNLDQLVDSRLESVYDGEQMNKLILAASLCVRQSSQRRPRMSRVLQILCSNQGRLQNICTREESTSMDFEDGEITIAETPTFGGSASDVKTHLALAMLGVEDDMTSQSSLDHSGEDLQHSSIYIEGYLEGRVSLSSSLVK